MHMCEVPALGRAQRTTARARTLRDTGAVTTPGGGRSWGAQGAGTQKSGTSLVNTYSLCH